MNEKVEQRDVINLPSDDGLLFACTLDGIGGGELKSWADLEAWKEGDGPVWAHLDRTSPRVQEWLSHHSGMTPVTVEAMLADETRPRSFKGKRGMIAILRGIDTNPGAEATDMLDIRVWSDGQRVLSIRHLKLMTPREILATLIQDGHGPKSISELFERLISRLTERISIAVDTLDEALDDIEENLASSNLGESRATLGKIRREAVVLRRYMAPQREAVSMIYVEPPDWLEDSSRLRLRETSNRLMQFVESIDEARERAVVLDDGIANQMSESMNRHMYVLSIIAAIFLPLGFITGLLGINVGGMPGVDNGMAFWITCIGIGVMLIAELLIFRLLKWI